MTRAIVAIVVLPLLSACPTGAPPPAPAPDTRSSVAWGGADLDAEQTAQRVEATVQRSAGLADSNRLEALHDALRRDLLDPWEQAWTARDAAALQRLGPGASLPSLADAPPAQAIGSGLQRASWTPTSTADSATLLSDYEQIDSARIEALRVVAGDDDARIDAWVDVRGTSAAGRRQDRGTVAVEATRVAGTWRLVAVTSPAWERLTALRPPAFTDATAAWGLADVLPPEPRDAVRSRPHALAIGDHDGDGDPDLLLGTAGASLLLTNQGGRFGPPQPLPGPHRVQAAAWADLDGDGDPDLVLQAFPPGDPRGRIDALVNGDPWRAAPPLPAWSSTSLPSPLLLADLDGDGDTDLVTGLAPVRGDRPRPPAEAMLRNDGGLLFSAPAPLPDPVAGVEGWDAFIQATALADVTGDGRPDLLATDDRGHLASVYAASPAGFTQQASDLGLPVPSQSMAMAVADWNRDGHPDVATTATALLSGGRVGASVPAGAPVPPVFEILRREYAPLVLLQGGARFADATPSLGPGLHGDGSAGPVWLDYDSDGWPDLYVPCGLWTGEDWSSTYLRAVAGALDEDDPLQSDVHGGPTLTTARAGPDPLLAILRDTPRGLGRSCANRLYRNVGGAELVEVGWLEGAARREDAEGAGVLDVDSDGALDLLIRNRSGSGPPLVLLRNGLAASSLSIELAGAAGARIRAQVGGRTLTLLGPGNRGSIQDEPRVHIGLDSGDGVEDLQIRWPDGTIQELGPQPAGRIGVTPGSDPRRLL